MRAILRKKQTKISTTTNPPEEMQDYTPPSACMSFILQFFFFHSSQQQYLNPKWEVKPPYKKLWNKTFLLLEQENSWRKCHSVTQSSCTDQFFSGWNNTDHSSQCPEIQTD